MNEDRKVCKKCGKQIEDGKYCKICKAERKESRKDVIKKGGRALLTVGVFVIGVVKSGGNNKA